MNGRKIISGMVAVDGTGLEVERVCTAEGMEADYEQLKLRLAGVCDNKIADATSIANFRIDRNAPNHPNNSNLKRAL
jgi:hypothetical protein